MAFEVRFKDESLEELQAENAKSKAYSSEVRKAFRKRIQFIRDAVDERDLYSMRSLHFERLQGKREHQYSMRLNDQWRLILEIQGESQKKTILIVAIEDYH
jgi:proteic killer suppression protein